MSPKGLIGPATSVMGVTVGLVVLAPLNRGTAGAQGHGRVGQNHHLSQAPKATFEHVARGPRGCITLSLRVTNLVLEDDLEDLGLCW